MKKLFSILLVLSSFLIGGCFNNTSQNESKEKLTLDNVKLENIEKNTTKRFTSLNSGIYRLGTTEWLNPSQTSQPFVMQDTGKLFIIIYSNKPGYVSSASICGYPINTTYKNESYSSSYDLYLYLYEINISEMKNYLTPIINHELKIKFSLGSGYESQTHSVRVTLGY